MKSKSDLRKKKFDKYEYYQKAVQGPEVDIQFLRSLYRRLRGREAFVLREDFCGTFLNLCEWVKRVKKGFGVGVDLDSRPINWGRQFNLSELEKASQSRIQIHLANVLRVTTRPADIIAAFNFSYFIFRERRVLRRYFRNCYRNLRTGGILVADSFGGSDCQGKITDRTRKRGFWYLWEQRGYDPISNRATFDIHIKRDGERIRKRVFTYHWRLWTIPEVSEIMLEAGFRKVSVYWQDDHGNFKLAKRGVGEASWLAHIVGEK